MLFDKVFYAESASLSIAVLYDVAPWTNEGLGERFNTTIGAAIVQVAPCIRVDEFCVCQQHCRNTVGNHLCFSVSKADTSGPPNLDLLNAVPGNKTNILHC